VIQATDKSKTQVRISAYTDGASSGNPGPAGWGVVIFLNQESVVELGGFEQRATNNKMELSAVIEALKHLKNTPGKLKIFSDSSYVINGVTKWIYNWKKNNWKTSEGKEVANQEEWVALDRLLIERSNIFEKPILEKVPGHLGVPGNERADKIANSFSTKSHISLYNGPYKAYEFELVKTALKIEPFYLSLVNGKIGRHETWLECEESVKHKKGAKFKKIKNSMEETETLKKWGLNDAKKKTPR